MSEEIELLLLTIVIVLNIFISEIRRHLLKDKPKNKEHWIFLVIAEPPLVVSGLLITYKLFCCELFDMEPSFRIDKIAVGLFLFAVMVLATYELWEWRKSFLKIFNGSETD